MIHVITEHPVAVDSPDHLHPYGCIQDNSTSPGFIDEVESYFGQRLLRVLDVGCAGGQMIVDFYQRGHIDSVGLEGSDVPRKRGLFNWPSFDADLWKDTTALLPHSVPLLHTCDVTKPFTIEKDGAAVKFDLITAWEVLEHFRREDLPHMFDNLHRHLSPRGIFVGSISYQMDAHPLSGVALHQTVASKDVWITQLIPNTFEVIPYPFTTSVRGENQAYSFLIGLRRRIP